MAYFIYWYVLWIMGYSRVPSYAYEDPAEVIFYPSALSPETADYGSLDVMPPSQRMINPMQRRPFSAFFVTNK